MYMYRVLLAQEQTFHDSDVFMIYLKYIDEGYSLKMLLVSA